MHISMPLSGVKLGCPALHLGGHAGDQYRGNIPHLLMLLLLLVYSFQTSLVLKLHQTLWMLLILMHGSLHPMLHLLLLLLLVQLMQHFRSVLLKPQHALWGLLRVVPNSWQHMLLLLLLLLLLLTLLLSVMLLLLQMLLMLLVVRVNRKTSRQVLSSCLLGSCLRSFARHCCR